MSLSKRVIELSPEKRRLLSLLMKEQRIDHQLLPLVRAERNGNVLPVSFAQQRLWFLDHLEPGNLAYIVAGAFRFDGPLDVDAFHKSIDEVIRRHEILRTSFSDIEGEPMQVIEEPQHLQVPLIDLSAFPDSQRAAEVQRLMENEAARSFDLEGAPLLRVTLLKLREHEHIVLLTMHHIISDGWSMSVLLQEVATLYEAFAEGKTASLPELSIQYANYAVWQREHLQGEVLDQQLTYWKNQLQDAPPLLELPSDRPRPLVRSSRGASIAFSLSREVAEGLRMLSRREGTTMFMTLLAAFKVLLHRYTGQSRIVVGTSVAGRNRKELEGLIGFFVNSLVLHTALSGASSFRDVLARVKETALGAYEHQELPFERLVEEFQADRSLSYTPLFQVFFSLQNAPRATKELGRLKTEALGEQSRTSKFDVSVDVMEVGDRIGGSFEYNTDLFEADTIRRMIGHFKTILQSVVNDPEQAISRLPLLTEVETQQLLSYAQCSGQLTTPDSCLHELFEAQVEHRPHAVAIVFEDQQLTYHDLNARANRLAHSLRKYGTGPDVLVAICVERSIDMIVGLLGILKAGGAYVPLDPAYPDERLAFMLDDSGAKILVTQSALASRFSQADVQVLNIDFEHEWPVQEIDDNLPSLSSSNTAAYMIYTSGSTGKPKGVVVTHANVLHLFEATQPLYHFNQSDVWTLFHSYAFDFSVWELWGALLYGGQLIIVPYLTSRSPAAFWELLRARQVTVLNQTPSAFRQLIANVSLSDSHRLRLVIFGGEALEPQALKPWFDSYGEEQPQLFNMYGITETTVHVTQQLLTTERCAQPSCVIGQPIYGLQLHIIDANMQLVPMLCPGELYVGGGNLARGYFNRPALTAERFVSHPFGDVAGGRLYKTGDAGRRLPDGQIEYLGRLDHQVKIRGFRIELGEIESVLAEHPHVREAVVIADENAERLTVYVVSDSEPDAVELRRYVAKRLPAHMVPASFVRLQELPLTRNGKIDRAALPAAETSMSTTEEDYVAARTPLEELLCGIWIELLSVARVGIYDNFFQLGGHSLLATRVLARVREAFEVEIPLRSIFESPTVAALAEQIQLAIVTNRGLVKPPIERIPRDGALPLSYVVERRVERELWAKQNSVYIRAQNIHSAIQWSGSLDYAAFEQSVNEIVRRHEILRTNFDLVNGEAVQFISETRTMTVRLIDLRHLDLGSRKAEAIQVATDEVKQRFDLSKDPLLRVTLFQLDEDKYIVLFVADHIVCDGWSMDVFFTEFTALYSAFTKGELSPLPELPFQYVDYSHWQRNWLQGEVLENLLSYWKKQLAGHGAFPEFELSVARPRLEVQDFAGAARVIVFSVELTSAIKWLSRRKGVTIFMMLLTGLKALLHRHSGRESIGVVSPAAYRTSVNTEGLIGWFAQLLILRTDMSGDPSFSQLLERVREVTLGAFTHQDIPLPYLLKEMSTGPWSEGVNKVVPYVFFNLDNYVKGMPVKEGKEAPAIPGVGIRKINIDTRSSEACLSIDIREHASAFGVLLNYETSIYDAETIIELLEHFESLMEAVVANPEQHLSQLPLLTRAQRNALRTGPAFHGTQEKAHE